MMVRTRYVLALVSANLSNLNVRAAFVAGARHRDQAAPQCVRVVEVVLQSVEKEIDTARS